MKDWTSHRGLREPDHGSFLGPFSRRGQGTSLATSFGALEPTPPNDLKLIVFVVDHPSGLGLALTNDKRRGLL